MFTLFAELLAVVVVVIIIIIHRSFFFRAGSWRWCCLCCSQQHRYYYVMLFLPSSNSNIDNSLDHSHSSIPKNHRIMHRSDGIWWWQVPAAWPTWTEISLKDSRYPFLDCILLFVVFVCWLLAASSSPNIDDDDDELIKRDSRVVQWWWYYYLLTTQERGVALQAPLFIAILWVVFCSNLLIWLSASHFSFLPGSTYHSTDLSDNKRSIAKQFHSFGQFPASYKDRPLPIPTFQIDHLKKMVTRQDTVPYYFWMGSKWMNRSDLYTM